MTIHRNSRHLGHPPLAYAALILGLPLAACDSMETRTQEVTATAYTLSEAETKKGNVGLAAWGDQLEPGMKAIAVSRDLIPLGLGHETVVTIEGLDGEYVVRDKMNRRWASKIDILMNDRATALEWGKQTVTITWQMPESDPE